MKPRQNKAKSAFKQLQQKWYGKIAKQGFVDIEDTNSPKERLLKWASWDFVRKRTQQYMEARRQYYLDCTEFLGWYKFANTRERKIWALHADGLSCRAVAAKVSLQKSRVHTILKALKIQMQRPV